MKPPEPSFEIYTADTREPIVELYSWEKAHQIAHMVIDDCPARSPLVMKDRASGKCWQIGVDECGLVGNCQVLEIAEAQAEYASGEFVSEQEIRAHLDDVKLRTRSMQTVRVRRTGNSNAVSLPRDFEELGYVAGAEVVVAAMPSGDLHVIHQYRVGEILREMTSSR